MTQDNKPTLKQAKAMELIREGVLPTVAMKEAGYSEETSSHPKQNLLRSPGVKSIIEQFKSEYTRLGITPAYLVKKEKEWLEAKKIVTSPTEPDKVFPDYSIQIKAGEMIRKDMGLNQDTPDNLKKRIIAEEFFE
jgi:hypothetical protein